MPFYRVYCFSTYSVHVFIICIFHGDNHTFIFYIYNNINANQVCFGFFAISDKQNYATMTIIM